MISRAEQLLDLRRRYDLAPIFSVEREALWAEIQKFEQGMDPDVIRAVICQVIFEPEAELEQLDLPLAA